MPDLVDPTPAPERTERDILVSIDSKLDTGVKLATRAVSAWEADERRKDAAQAARYDIYKQVLQPKVVTIITTSFSVAILAIVVAVTQVDADILDILHVAPAAEENGITDEASSDADDPQNPIDALDAASPGG